MAGAISRLRRAWAALQPEQRLAAACAAALFATMFLPWYSNSTVVSGRSVSDSLRAFEAFSFVEAAVLLVAAGVLTLLFARGEQKRFHLPGGDGTVILAAGGWAALLTFIRTLDKPDAGPGVIVGVEWGIFVAILAGLALAVAGARLRQAHLAEPGEAPTRRAPRPPRTPPPAERRGGAVSVSQGPLPDPHAAETEVAPRREPPDGRQLSFDEQD